MDFIDTYRTCVEVTRDNDSYVSSGMQSFGLADARVPYLIAAHVAEDVIHAFNLYRLTEKRVFGHREQFFVEQYPLRFWVVAGVDSRTEQNVFGILDLLLL